MGEMTLEQVLYILRGIANRDRGQYEYIDRDDAKDMADAIDAHLAKAAEPVCRAEGMDYNGMLICTPLSGHVSWNSEDGLLYAAPPSYEPAQPVEVVGEGFAQMIEHHEHMGRDAHGRGESAQAAMHETYAALLRAAIAHPRPAVTDSDRAERMLSELVDKIVPGLDTGDLLADAVTASRALDASPTGEQAGDVVRELLAREYDAFGQPDSAVFVREGNDIPDDWLIHVTTALRIAEQASAQTRPAAPESGGG